MKDQAKQSS